MARAVPKKILVATDFSETSDEAVRPARELATALRASLHLLHVVSSDLGPGAPERIAEELNHQHTLGYVPEHPPGRRYHRIRVEVTRPGGHTVRARWGCGAVQ